MKNKQIKKLSKEIKKRQDEYDDIFDDEPEIPIIKKKSSQQVQQNEIKRQYSNQFDRSDSIRCPIPSINVEQTLQDILYESSKESQFSKSLKLLISQGQRDLKDKKKYYHYKWQSLSHANCGREEYYKQQNNLKESEEREILEIRNGIIAKLNSNKVQGFASKDDILSEFRANFMKRRMMNYDGPIIEEFQFYVDQADINTLIKNQHLLLDKLLSESTLIKEDVKPSFIPRHLQKQQLQQEDNQKIQIASKINVQKLREKFKYEQIQELLTLNESESLVIPKSVRVMMLDTKCDELYTDPKFRQSQVEKYIHMYNFLKARFQNFELSKLLELTIYIVNNVHYQHKFRLPEDRRQVKARDLLQFLEKLR
ncbi:hypothetical protein pb186bvf_014797 [Paramecium bursaria]